MNKIKHTIFFALALLMTAGAWATQIWDSRDCHVMLDDNNVLTITGTGLMEDYAEVSARGIMLKQISTAW